MTLSQELYTITSAFPQPTSDSFVDQESATHSPVQDQLLQEVFTEVHPAEAAKIESAGADFDVTDKECGICLEEFPNKDFMSQSCDCKEKLCEKCHGSIIKEGTTISGENVQFLKCPFCRQNDGTEFGRFVTIFSFLAVLKVR
jgi:hypothetical protein